MFEHPITSAVEGRQLVLTCYRFVGVFCAYGAIQFDAGNFGPMNAMSIQNQTMRSASHVLI
jgi:hypothetical protein